MSITPAPWLPDWLPDAIFYQIFPDRFCNGDPFNDPPGTAAWEDLPTRQNFFGGDLQGVLDRLDYLQELGATALYLTPIFSAPSNHKYDTRDYFQVDPAFGDNDLLKALVREIHRRGMHVILDGVFNHCGDQFPAFQDVRLKGALSAYAEWFRARSYPVLADPLNYMTCGGAAFLPKLNHNHRPVRDFILDVGRYWLEQAGIDGWRLDVPWKAPMDFWREFRQATRSANPQAYLVGEVWREAAAWVSGGDIFDGVTNYRLRELLLAYVQTQFLDAEDFAFETGQLDGALGPAAPGMLNLLGSHDTARILTVLGGEVSLLEIALTYLMTTPGAPLIYYGDEVGLLGENDPDCRRPMPWQPERWNPAVVDMHRRLIGLRKAHPVLRLGRRQVLFVFNGAFAYRMEADADEVIVILNPRAAVRDVRLPVGEGRKVWRDAWGERVYAVQDGVLALGDVAARSVQVLLPVAG